jgi:hypothetical protein
MLQEYDGALFVYATLLCMSVCQPTNQPTDHQFIICLPPSHTVHAKRRSPFHCILGSMNLGYGSPIDPLHAMTAMFGERFNSLFRPTGGLLGALSLDIRKEQVKLAGLFVRSDILKSWCKSSSSVHPDILIQLAIPLRPRGNCDRLMPPGSRMLRPGRSPCMRKLLKLSVM